MIFNGEKFRSVLGAPGYFVSRRGTVISNRRNKAKPYFITLRQFPTKSGYWRVSLWVDRKLVSRRIHRLVAEAWLPPKIIESHNVNHKNGNKKDNRAENLEWVSHRENMLHCWRKLHPGTRKGLNAGTKQSNSKLNDDKVRAIRIARRNGVELTELAKKYGVDFSTIGKAARGETWDHIAD